MTLIIYPYKMSSKSSRVLSQSLGAMRVYPDRNYKPKRNHTIINWGSSKRPDWYDSQVTWLNHENDLEAVKKAANKRLTFNQFLLHGVDHPDWTDDTECAQSWVDNGLLVYGRKTLTGHSGSGIIIFDSETICSSMECPLYTLATKAKYEYRIHIGTARNTQEPFVIDAQQKKKRNGFEGGTQGIRNHSNGWVYAREGINIPDVVIETSKKAIKALGLDFGACDVGYNMSENKAYVYEVNTAPGLEGTTLTKYTDYFKEKYYEF